MNSSRVFRNIPIWQFLLAITITTPGCEAKQKRTQSGKSQVPSQYQSSSSSRSTDKTVATKENADLKILFIGNSHTRRFNLPGTFAHLVHIDGSNKKVYTQQRTGSMFLDGHVNDKQTLAAIEEGGWDYVVLQAQKYSTSGKYHYSYDSAIKLGKLAQEKGAKVLLFPEWGRRGNTDEATRVQKIHQEISEKLKCEVVPVGLVWDAVLESNRKLKLHATDGNHANEAGVYLTACVFYAQILDRSPEGLGFIGIKAVKGDTLRKLLQKTAWDVVQGE